MTNNIERAIGRLEGQMDALTKQLGHFNAHLDAIDQRTTETHTKVTEAISEKKGERRVIAALSAVLGATVASAINLFK